MSFFRERFPIEKYALLTESAPELGARLDEWLSFYRPSTPGERELMEFAVMASVQRRRVLAHQTEVVNHEIRTARYRHDCKQEDEVEHCKGMLTTDPARAVLGLKRSALGCRFLIQRWERLQTLMADEGTWYGNDRNEAIQYQGAIASRDRLVESEAAYLTWLYCLMAQPNPKDAHIAAMGPLMPEALNIRETLHWFPARSVCRQLLKALAERELAAVRLREEVLRIAYEEPGREGAEARSQVLEGKLGAQLLRHARIHELQFLAAYKEFLKGRKETARTGLRPALPRPKPRPNTTAAAAGESATGDAQSAADPAETVEDAAARRKQPGRGAGTGRSRRHRLAHCPRRRGEAGGGASNEKAAVEEAAEAEAAEAEEAAKAAPPTAPDAPVATHP